MSQSELRDRVAELVALLWRGVPSDLKSKYRMNIWEQFENNIRSAAYTSNLAKFVNSLCLKMGSEIGRNADDREQANALLATLPDRAALKMLREETALIVLMVRVAIQERRDEWEPQQEKGQA